MKQKNVKNTKTQAAQAGAVTGHTGKGRAGSAPAGSGRAAMTARGEQTRIWELLPLMAVVAIVPLIVWLHIYDSGLTDYDFFVPAETYYESGGSTDFFLYYKMVWFCVFAGIMALLVAVRMVRNKGRIEFAKVFIPLGVYAFLALLSSICSEYQPYPFTGVYEQFESVWALLGYCVVTYYAFLVIQTEHDFKYIVAALLAGTVLMLVIGITQAFFTDIYQSKIGAYLMMPAKYAEAGEATFNFEKGRVYLSLYNPNYVGSYVPLLSALFLVLAFATRRIYMRIVYIAIYIGLLLTLFGAQSRAGIVGVVVSVVVMGILFGRRLFKNWFAVALTVILLVGTFYTYNNYAGDIVTRRIKAAFDVNETAEYNLTDIQTLDDEVIFVYKGNNLHVNYVYDYEGGDFTMHVYDDDYASVNVEVSDDSMTFSITDDERFSGITLGPQLITDDVIGFYTKIDGHMWYFADVDGSMYMYSPFGKFVKGTHSESAEWLERYSRLASGRGYIWAKTLPLLKDNILLGSGADTFVFEFPNADFVSIYNGGYDGNLMTKPHNMYLQMAVQTGVVSLVAFLVFYFWFFISGVITAFRLRKYSFCACCGIGILSGSAGYMVVQMINDSSITVAPLYWAFIGLGMACFRIAKKESEAVNE